MMNEFELGDSVVVGKRDETHRPFKRFKQGSVTAIAKDCVRVLFKHSVLFGKSEKWFDTRNPYNLIEKIEY